MSRPLTISALARRFGLSRSALLHYDRIGLLSPSGRSLAGYRCYSEADADRLRAIQTFRQAGVPLAGIRALLDDDGMDRLHAQFEQTDPAAHQRFLESLGLDAGHIARVRSQSR